MGKDISVVRPWVKRGFTMGNHQIHKRHSLEFVEEVLEAFNEKRMTEEMACELLGIKRARLYG